MSVWACVFLVHNDVLIVRRSVPSRTRRRPILNATKRLSVEPAIPVVFNGVWWESEALP